MKSVYKLFLLLLVISSITPSCTVQKAVTYEQRKIHTDAIGAQPGWKVERSTIGKYTPYYVRYYSGNRCLLAPLVDLFNAGFGMLLKNFIPSENRLNDAAFAHDIPGGKFMQLHLIVLTNDPNKLFT